MNSHEIRVGNYWELNNEIVSVVVISGDGSTVKVRLPSGRVGEVNIHYLKPIALNSDQLADYCLFDAHGNHVVGIDHHTYCLKLHKEYIALYNRDNEPVIHFWDVKYLHQFQNLYYTLTGKELEITFSCRLF